MNWIIVVLLSVCLMYRSGVSATCISDADETISAFSSRDIDVISNIPAVSRCIRCAYFSSSAVFVTDPEDVMYFDGATLIMNGSISGVTIFDDGLLVEDAASSFSNDDTIRCVFNDGSQSGDYTITFKISAFLPPPITPNVTVLDYVEGDNVNLTCTGDSVANDVNQWTLPDGSLIPAIAIVADSGLILELKNVNRTDSGVYNCTGTITALSISVVSSVTLNIQYPAKVFSFSTSTNILPVTTILTLNCSFEGNPTPSVLWFRNDTVIGIENNPTNGYATFDVTFATIADTGLYSCGANNSIGNEGSSQVLVTAQVAPDPVSVFQNDSSTDTTITVSWSYGFNGNAPITGVDITYSATGNYGNGLSMGDETGSTSTTSDQLSLTIPNLQPLTTYQFSITVNNSVSDTVGSSSAVTVSADTLPIAPYEPTAVTVTPIDSISLTVSWTATVNDNIQTPLMGFVVQYNILGNSMTESILITDGTARSHDITGLRKGTMYQVRVQSANSAGNSPFSDDGQGRTDIDPPSAVVGLQPTSNPFSICVQWNEPEDNGGQNISGYTVYLWNKDEYETENFVFVSSVGAAVLTYTVENLDNDTEYFIRVAASNADQGLGMNSTVNATTGQPLQVDPNFNVTAINITAVSAAVSWTVTSNDIQYRLQIVQEGDDFDPDRYTNLTGNSRQSGIPNLEPLTVYDIRLTRIEGGGCTRRVSEIISFTTIALRVEIPEPINVTNNTVVAGTEVVLECRLNTGGVAPNVTWKFQDGPLPEGATVDGYRMTLSDPVVNDTGNYSCTAREGTTDENTFTFFLLVQARPLIETSTTSVTMSPTVDSSPTIGPASEILPVWVIGVIAAGAFLCIVFFLIVLIVFIYCCCKKAGGEKETGRYDLAKPAKSANSGMWLDEGASGFSSVIATSGNEHDAPVNRGRTMTNDYVSATSFNTIDKKGSTDKLYEEDHPAVNEKYSSDV